MRCAWLLLIALYLDIAPVSATAATERIVIVSSHNRTDVVLEPVIHGIHEALSSRTNLVTSVEYLDDAQNRSARQVETFALHLGAKYGDVPVQAVISLGDPAFQFTAENRSAIFPGAPIVFGQIPDHGSADIDAVVNSTGILGGYSADGTIALLHQLHPTRRQLVLVNDHANAEVWLSHGALDFIQREAFDQVTTLGGNLTMADLEAAVAELGNDHVVVYVSFTRDAEGMQFDTLESLARVSRASAVPVYGALDSMAGYGIMGGHLLAAHELGREIGALTLRVLDGEKADTIPPVRDAPHHFVFDYRQLERFGMSINALPDGARVIEEPDTFYYRYRAYLYFALAVGLAMAVYIAILISGIARHERARRGLERLLAAGETALPVSHPKALIESIDARLRRVVPKLREVSFEPALAGAGRMLRQGREEPAVPRRNSYDGYTAVLALNADQIPAKLARCRADRRLDAVDQRLLDVLTRSLAIECENLRAAQLSSSLETARRIQCSLLPSDCASTGADYGLDIHAALRPAREVGGDLYDVFSPTPNRLVLAIGDVSDKGVPAALLMAITRTLIRGLAETEERADRLLAGVNRRLAAENESLMFVTLLLATVDRSTGHVTIANAGHHPPLLRAADGAVRTLDIAANIALGVDGGAVFDTSTLSLGEGEMLLAYTDGVTEAENARGVQFGEARLAAVLQRAGRSSRNTVESVLAAVAQASEPAPQADDVTLLAVNRPG